MLKNPSKETPKQYIEVALNCPLRQVFDYTLPAAPCAIKPGTRVSVPFGKRTKVIGIVLNTKNSTTLDPQKVKPVEEILDQKPIIYGDIFALCTWASQYYQHPIGEVLATALPKLLRAGHSLEITGKNYYQLTKEAKQLNLHLLSRKPAQAKAIELLLSQENSLFSKPELKAFNITSSTLNNLVNAGYIRFNKKLDLPSIDSSSTAQKKLSLNSEQQLAANTVALNFFQSYLLDGITGSGKTEVYFQIIDRVIENNRQCLVLIPEISLTPQTISRFQKRFHVPIAALHSGLSDKERLNAWLFAKNNYAKIIIGTRSAIFTPFENLGLIIVDEEHDSSFKQQEGFRYHARDLAILRAKNNNIPVVLGSATVSIESYHNSQNSNKYKLIHLTQRAGNAKPPTFKLIDLNEHRTENCLSQIAIKQIEKHLTKQEQVLIFINRRGYSPILFCQSCRWQARCPRCDCNLVWHKQRNQLACHHCGKQISTPPHCPECSSTSLAPLGQGTQRLAEYLETLFPLYPLIRIDRDSVKNKNQLEQQLAIIHQNKPCLLIGTQMLAKGHHFPNVTLVVILDIDQGLIHPDFRALEKTAQLIMQVAGRAGRAEKAGTVLLQTLQPQHYLFKTLITQHYQSFLALLSSERETCLLPPFGYLALFRAEAKNPSDAFNAIKQIKDILEQQANQYTTVYDAIPASMQRKAGFFRVQLLTQSPARLALQKLLADCLPLLGKLPALKNIRWSVDVDPVDVG